MRLYLLRHAAPLVRDGQPSAQWHLSPEGRAAADRLADDDCWHGVTALYASPEPKAIGTAQRIAARHGLPLRIAPDLREVERPWVEDGYPDLVRRYLAGETLDGWEPRSAALGRVRGVATRAGESARPVALVSHGLLLTLYVSELLGIGSDEAYAIWSAMRFPDLAVVDTEARRVEWPFGGG